MDASTLPNGLNLSNEPTYEEIASLENFLRDQGTFNFPRLSSGLFSAAAAENPEFRLTGYQNVWTRDNIHVIHAHWVLGDKDTAVRAISSLLRFYESQRDRFRAVIHRELSHADPMNRPHIRFDGEELAVLDVRWAHAQNDALGYLLWLTCKLLRAGDLSLTPEISELLLLLPDYFNAIEYWCDEDSGHWEETRKIEASSIGTVVAGLFELRALSAEHPIPRLDLAALDSLLEKGENALAEILPAECVQDDPLKKRDYDAALLFLIYPLDVVRGEMADKIIADIREHLTGPIGIRRYNGDSYWCANYRDLLSAESRTTDFSDDMSERDKLLKPGEEAQWCIFDPILSVIHGQRYLKDGDESQYDLQIEHFRRSLAQLTSAESRFPAFRCPESYFLEHGEWIPNDITPLLWTQGNLLLAFHRMKEVSLRRSDRFRAGQ